MAELVLGAFVTVLIEKLASGSSQYGLNFIRCVGIDELLKEWSETLERIRDVLEDAGEKQLTNREVKRWLDDLHDLAYDVDDFVDELATEAQACRIRLSNGSRASTSRFPNCISAASLFNNCGINPAAFIFNCKMKLKIDGISRRLQVISNRRGPLELKQINIRGCETGVTVQLPTTSFPPSRVIGREKEKEEIVKMLMKPEADSAQVPVITILGMGGMGKTTLAQHVYQDKQVESFFDLRAWVCVSDVFDVTGITRAILKSDYLTKKTEKEKTPGADNTETVNIETLDLNQLQGRLKRMLSGKKFLVVLDDIWNENYDEWEILLRPFPFGAAEAGSRILATTRNEKVASTMSPTRSWYHLTELGDSDCLSLLATHALGRDDFDLHLHLKESGKQIVEKCGRLPLAIKMVAGLLRNQPQRQCEWEDVINSKKWAETSDRILPALRLSYHHLPSHLKRCFAYCSIIPKDYIFGINDLVLLWMAEGLLQPPVGGSSKRMEDFGRDCLQELLSRSFFQLIDGSETEFIMHDLINDLAVHVAGERCFRMDEDWDDNHENYKISERTRHLSFIYQRNEDKVSKKFNVFNTARRSRTFLQLAPSKVYLYYGYFKISDEVLALTLSRLQSLRVLSLRGYAIVELPHEVGALKHLRYLNLSHTSIKKLPQFVCSLYNLQTLSLNGCNNLCELPSSIGCLTNLRHLDLENTSCLEKMPSTIGKLTSLQTLSKIIVGRDKRSCNLKDLKDLRHLRETLSIKELQNVTDDRDAVAADLRSKEHLEILKLRWDDWGTFVGSADHVKQVLENLQPHCNLKELEIEGYRGVEFPSWVGGQSMSNVVRISFDRCSKITHLPPLGELPRLRDLRICNCRELEKLPNGLHGLASLEVMVIRNCPSLVWDATDRLPESLVELKLWNCTKSWVVLSNLGFHRLTSLQTLVLLGFKDVVSFEQVVGIEVEGESNTTSTSYLFPPSLTQLLIGEFPNLESLSNSLQNLTSLRKLGIYNCPKLESLAGADDDQASLQIISSLHYLYIHGNLSEVLRKHCEEEEGKYWPTIQHIPELDIEDD